MCRQHHGLEGRSGGGDGRGGGARLEGGAVCRSRGAGHERKEMVKASFNGVSEGGKVWEVGR